MTAIKRMTDSQYFYTPSGKVRARFTMNNANYSYYLGRKFIGVAKAEWDGPTKEDAAECARLYVGEK